MAPMSSPVRTRLDPAYPLLWRDADTVQFGLDPVLTVDAGEPWVEPLLNALRTGFRRSAFDVIAHGVGAPREEARRLLHRLRPVLREDLPLPPAAWVEAVNVADPRAEPRARDGLADEGIRLSTRADASAVGVVLVHGAASAMQLRPCLRDDVAHLPLAFEPGSLVVGPLVVPGRSPCLSCRDAQERDRDPAWPTLHAQLIAPPDAPIPAARVAEAAALAARILRSPRAGDGSRVVRVSPDGARVWSSVMFHAECRCREPSSRSPQGTATALAPPARRPSTRTPPAFARPA